MRKRNKFERRIPKTALPRIRQGFFLTFTVVESKMPLKLLIIRGLFKGSNFGDLYEEPFIFWFLKADRF